MLAACSSHQAGGAAPVEDESSATDPGFDPLGTSADRQVVPETYPVSAELTSLTGSDTLINPSGADFTGLDSSVSVTYPTDVYRVQIYTSRLLNEARRELAIAEEIFNFPVHLDYEVPYYKLRVGDFETREEAEDVISEIKAIGYRNAWVARVKLRIQQGPDLEVSDDPLLQTDPTDFLIDSLDVGETVPEEGSN